MKCGPQCKLAMLVLFALSLLTVATARADHLETRDQELYGKAAAFNKDEVVWWPGCDGKKAIHIPRKNIISLRTGGLCTKPVPTTGAASLGLLGSVSGIMPLWSTEDAPICDAATKGPINVVQFMQGGTLIVREITLDASTARIQYLNGSVVSGRSDEVEVIYPFDSCAAYMRARSEAAKRGATP
jgi:hypothetical protein